MELMGKYFGYGRLLLSEMMLGVLRWWVVCLSLYGLWIEVL